MPRGAVKCLLTVHGLVLPGRARTFAVPYPMTVACRVVKNTVIV